MMSWPILSVTTFLPLVGALFIMMMRSDGDAEQRNARWVALWTTLITFAISLIMLYRFDPGSAEFQFIPDETVPQGYFSVLYVPGIQVLWWGCYITFAGAFLCWRRRSQLARRKARQPEEGEAREEGGVLARKPERVHAHGIPAEPAGAE